MAKTGNRNRFQKQFIPKDKLLEIFPLIQTKISKLKQSYMSQQIQDHEFCASYILEFYKIIYPGKWNMGASPLPFTSVHEDSQTLFQNNIRSLPFAVRDALGKWSTCQYPIRLYFDVPMSLEILKMQTEGFRCVTAITEENLKYYVMDERDPLSFLIHDLLHAHHFWSDPQNASAQVEIYKWLYSLLQEGHLTKLLEDELFKKGFEYISSDMNTHPLHLLKTFKFHIDDYFTRNQSNFTKKDYWEQISQTKAQPEAQLQIKKGKFIQEFSLLNTPLETRAVAESLLSSL